MNACSNDMEWEIGCEILFFWHKVRFGTKIKKTETAVSDCSMSEACYSLGPRQDFFDVNFTSADDTVLFRLAVDDTFNEVPAAFISENVRIQIWNAYRRKQLRKGKWMIINESKPFTDFVCVLIVSSRRYASLMHFLFADCAGVLKDETPCLCPLLLMFASNFALRIFEFSSYAFASNCLKDVISEKNSSIGYFFGSNEKYSATVL